MLRTSALALAALLTAGAASAETVVVHAAAAETFEIKREVVDTVQRVYGDATVYEDADALPDALQDEIRPGETLPDHAMQAVPGDLGDLPTSAGDGRWVRAGNHLVEVDGRDRIVMVVYDALG